MATRSPALLPQRRGINVRWRHQTCPPWSTRTWSHHARSMSFFEKEAYPSNSIDNPPQPTRIIINYISPTNLFPGGEKFKWSQTPHSSGLSEWHRWIRWSATAAGPYDKIKDNVSILVCFVLLHSISPCTFSLNGRPTLNTTLRVRASTYWCDSPFNSKYSHHKSIQLEIEIP